MSDSKGLERVRSEAIELRPLDELPPHIALGPRPPRLTLLSAARRHPLWVIVPAILGLVAGIAAGLLRDPVYTAESSLILARAQTSQAVTGDLAAAYSRAVFATPVVREVAKKLDLPEDTVSGSLSAAPQPNSPVVRVIASRPTEDETIRTANAASDAVRKYLQTVNGSDRESRRLFRAYQAASKRFSRANAEVENAKLAIEANPSSEVATQRLTDASVERDTAQLTRDGLQSAYNTRVETESETDFISPLTTANSAESDRASKLQLFAFIGLAVGLVVGLALALLRGNAVIRSATAG